MHLFSRLDTLRATRYAGGMFGFGKDRASKGAVHDLTERVHSLDAEVRALRRMLDDLDERLVKLRRSETREAREAAGDRAPEGGLPSPRDPAAYRRWKRGLRGGNDALQAPG